MGFFWDLMQQSQISNQEQRADSIEDRVQWLERELDRTNDLLYRLLEVLETRFGEDLDGDGRIG
ncbi:MAG: hypothetical protein ACYTFG_08005 [Planctomycetota bacterium]|jgi:hypothetical protein